MSDFSKNQLEKHNFILYSEKNYICTKCGWQSSTSVVATKCTNDNPLQIEPGILEKLGNFGSALIQHIKSGFNSCSEEEIIERWNICRSNECGFYKRLNEDYGECTHKSCGCNVSGKSIFLNKLAWEDQSCPIGKWPAIEEKS